MLLKLKNCGVLVGLSLKESCVRGLIVSELLLEEADLRFKTCHSRSQVFVSVGWDAQLVIFVTGFAVQTNVTVVFVGNFACCTGFFVHFFVLMAAFV